MISCGVQAIKPETPSNMVPRTSLCVGATTAIWASGLQAPNHQASSAAVLVLPNPRPASTNHVRQSPGGVICVGLAVASHFARACAAGDLASDCVKSLSKIIANCCL